MLGSISIVFRRVTDVTTSLRALRPELAYLAATWGDVVVVGTCVPPRIPPDMFKVFFDGVRDCVVLFLLCPVLILGDINAKCTLQNVKGKAVAD